MSDEPTSQVVWRPDACRCDGSYRGCGHGRLECGNTGGGHRSPYFCIECDPRRIAHITASFESIAEEFQQQGGFEQRDTHELKYRAGSSGLAKVGIPDVATPYWYCTCGQWQVNRDLQGRPFREAAEKRHRKHVKDAQHGPVRS
jgi:hypothetical protein